MPETIHNKSIEERLGWLKNLSAEHSLLYRSPEAHMSRVRYSAKHPTGIFAFKCMDGRMHLPFITKTPLGIIKPFRNLGGAFDLGWPYLGEIVSAAVMSAVQAGRRVLILITYHYSKGDRMRGCAGFDHDKDKALAAAFNFKRQVEYIFGADHQTINTIVVGVETDEDALIFHGEGGMLDVSSMMSGDAAQDEDTVRELIQHRLREIYPEMHRDVLADLMPLAIGNVSHMAELKATPRTLGIEHHEWVLCVGRGFDFLRVPNTALIVGPYSPDVAEPIVMAASLIQSNMEAGRIPDDGMLLLASSPYNEAGVDYRRAVEKARFLSRFSAETIKRNVPYIHERMIRLTCVLNYGTRELQEIGMGGG